VESDPGTESATHQPEWGVREAWRTHGNLGGWFPTPTRPLWPLTSQVSHPTPLRLRKGCARASALTKAPFSLAGHSWSPRKAARSLAGSQEACVPPSTTSNLTCKLG
jgi:hypothetical protein